MLSFKEFVEWGSRPQVLTFYPYGDKDAAANAAFLIEGGRTWDIDKRWSVRQDRTHHDPTKAHLHLMFRGKDAAILNRDGSTSHNMPADNVPNNILDRVRKMGLLEGRLLVEEVNFFSVPDWVIDRAMTRAYLNDIVATITERRRS